MDGNRRGEDEEDDNQCLGNNIHQAMRNLDNRG